MVMQSMRSGAVGSIMKFVLFGLLMMAVLGLVFMDVNGVFGRGLSVGDSDVAKIEGHSISLQSFDRTLRRAVARVGMTPQQAYQTGYLQEVLASEVRANFVMLEADRLGLKIDKSMVAEKTAEVISPLVENGQTLQQTFEKVLAAQGMTEDMFTQGISREMIGNILADTVQKSFEGGSEQLSRDLVTFQHQTRDIELVAFMDNEITDVAAPTDEQLQRLYDVLKDSKFAIPEYRALKIGIIDGSNLKSEIAVSDDEIQKYYDDNIDAFLDPQKHVMEQAILKTLEEAEKVIKMVKDDGKSLPDAIKAMKDSDNIPLTPPVPFEIDMLPVEFKDAVTNAKDGEYIGPLQTALGYHVAHLIEVIPEHTKALKDVQDTIREDLLSIKVDDRVYELSSELDDALAGGATLDEAGKQVPLKIVDIPATSDLGQDDKGENAFLPYGDDQEKDRDTIVKTAFDLQQGEISRVIELPSGHFAAIQVASIQEKSFKPFADAKEEISAQYMADQQRAVNGKKISDDLEKLLNGKTDLEAIAKDAKKDIQQIKGITIGGVLPAPVTEGGRPVIFQTKVGGYTFIPLEGGSALVKITGYTLPEIDEASERDVLPKVLSTVEKETKDEVFAMYIESIGKKYTAMTNNNLLEKTYAPSSETESY
ncbi:MAG: peptidyl-prolyl cis-trans isomerase [Alphaproteobacteria bacterium]|nr:peptidyl-prolyl cis-trans isomerase [Alphaproteobacteria bacterium]